MSENLIIAGKIVAVHGIKGLVKINSFLDNIKDFEVYKFYLKTGEIVNISPSFYKKNQVIAKFENISDRNSAEEAVGTELFIQKSALKETDEDEVYYQDLVGLAVFDYNDKSQKIGEIVNVLNFGAGDIIEISIENSSKTSLYNFDEQTFPELDLEEEKIFLNAPETVNV